MSGYARIAILLLAVSAAALVLFGCETAQATTIYVNDDATGADDGSSWEDAFTDLQNGFDAAVSAGDEVWVAAGTYYPSVEIGGVGDRYMSFQLKNGMAVYGGFAGVETLLEERDWEANATILSADIGVPDDKTDNCYHVVYNPEDFFLDETAVLDGVTLTRGNASGTSGDTRRGGGMYNEDASPTVANCMFLDNDATGSTSYSYGGGMFNYYSSPQITNCTFTNNVAGKAGGAMGNTFAASPTVVDCVFEGNFGGLESSGNGDGGALYNGNSCSPLFVRCDFLNNGANYNGGASYNTGDTSFPCFINCSFIGNSVRLYGGAMYNTNETTTMIQCTVIDNEATAGNAHGGAMYNFAASPVLTNCVFYGNDSGCVGEGIYSYQYSDPVITNCILMGSDVLYSASSSEPVVTYCNVEQPGFEDPLDHNISEDPLFVDPVGGDFQLQADSPCIDAANNEALPADTGDLDDDGDVLEEIPFDFFDNVRRIDDGDTPDTGNGTAPIVDMGVHEFGDAWVSVPDVAGFRLSSFPNPFNPHTTIMFSLPEPSQVSLNIYDCGGRLVKVLLDSRRTAGQHEIVWTSEDHDGERVASGVYFCVLCSDRGTSVKKLVLLK